MTFHPLPGNSSRSSEHNLTMYNGDPDLRKFVNRLAKKMERDDLIQQTTDELRAFLGVDRVVLYYFYREWKGQVTFESLSDNRFSILGSTGPDECFNNEYAALYLAGRVRAIADIELEPIHKCHRDLLRVMQVRANLVVPIVSNSQLWGLLIAHHCQDAHPWSSADIEMMQRSAKSLSNAPAIRDS